MEADYIYMDFIIPLFNQQLTNYSLYHITFSVN